MRRRERSDRLPCRRKEEIAAYVERGWARNVEPDCTVLSAKVEQSFDDLGHDVHVWNVKTDKDDWWVVEGDGLPMNLYPQGAFYFSADEAYSFHLGVMARVLAAHERDPNTLLGPVSHGALSLVLVRRKLEEAARAFADADEPEHFQAVGLMCREALIALGQEILTAADLSEVTVVPQGANFKTRARLAIDRLLPGAENAERRSHARKVCDAAWEFCSSLTHSPNRTPPDAAIALSLAGATQSLFENLLDKAEGPGFETRCPVCHSRRLELTAAPTVHEDPHHLRVVCAHCGWEDLAILIDEVAPGSESRPRAAPLPDSATDRAVSLLGGEDT